MVHLVTVLALVCSVASVQSQEPYEATYLKLLNFNTVQNFLQEMSEVLNIRHTLQDQAIELATVKLPDVFRMINESINASIANTSDETIKLELNNLWSAVIAQEFVLNNLTRHYGINNGTWRRPREYSNNMPKSLRGGFDYSYGHSHGHCFHHLSPMQIITIIQSWVRTAVLCTYRLLNIIRIIIRQGAVVLDAIRDSIATLLTAITSCLTDPNILQCLLAFGPELLAEIEDALLILADQLEVIANGSVQDVEDCIFSVLSSVEASIICH